MRRVTLRERRMLAGAGAVALAVAAWMLVWLPLAGKREQVAAELSDVRSRLVASHSLLAAGRHYPAEVEGLGRLVKEREARLFSGEQPSLLGARLQKLYKDMAEASGLTVKSEQILESEVIGEIVVVPVEITVGGNTGQLDGFLESVEGNDRTLRVDRFSIRVPNIIKPTQVTATMRISGFLLPGSGS